MDSSTSPLKRDVPFEPHVWPVGRPAVGRQLDPRPGPRIGSQAVARVRAEGKFLYAGHQKFDIQGVTYGPFRPAALTAEVTAALTVEVTAGSPTGGAAAEAAEGAARRTAEAGVGPRTAALNGRGAVVSEYHDPATVDRDFRAIAAAGFNAVRIYTVPPVFLLDAALAHGLRVMVGLPWEQHVTFLDDRKITRRIVASVRAGVRACAGHPALLCFALGNEIPASIVRWHGPAAIERFIRRLYRVAKSEDPDTLVTYVSYPTTEYLRLPFLDFITFNVYLETQDRTADYIARLQNIAGELPLVMAEVGLDSIRNGEEKQAESLSWQVRTTFQGGCAGTFVFSWTDEWHRGGHDITDWAFGLVTADRRPKPALAAVQDALKQPLLPPGVAWPMISVVVCSYNGESTIRETLDAIQKLDYSNYEVIVVNDGSTDRTRDICAEYDVRLISVPNGGLSSARNIGMRAAKGEIVAYIDDDAYPDPHWLSFLAIGFLTRDHVGIGGPNLAPHDDGLVADCVANSPGGPSHVLYTDLLAEHLPGCNMAFRRDAILAIDGFDTRFRIAGDDVDLCWRLIECGGTLGFHAGAVVWHHRRGTVQAYLRQQRNYGRAEAMLEQKWPEKYNRLGHLRWAGKLYGKGHTTPLALRHPPIQHGVWGTRLFQSMYTGDFDSAWYITLMPEWYLVTLGLSGLTLLGILWAPLFWLLPLLFVAVIVPLVQVAFSVSRAKFTTPISGSRATQWRLLGITTALHVMQPMVRLVGRLGHRLSPWRQHGVTGLLWPRTQDFAYWSEHWQSPTTWLTVLEKALHSRRVLVRRGGEHDRWDLQAVCGLFGGVRLVSTIEEHGSGKQLVRVRAWPRVSVTAMVLVPVFAALSAAAAFDQAWAASAVLAGIAAVCVYRVLRECGNALHTVQLSVDNWLPAPDSANSKGND